MKTRIYFLYFCCCLLLISFQTAQAQQTSVPTSKIIDAKTLLRDVETLSADRMQGRGIDTPGGALARAYVLEKFKKAGLAAFGNSYLQPFEVVNRNNAKVHGTNVVGYVKGAKNPGKYMIVTAHYDHLGVRGGEIYNGADDNASGVCALFAFADYLKKHRPANSVIFVAFDGEETGLLGSRKFVAEPPVKIESIVLNVNLDMVSHNDKNELYAAGTFHYPFLKPYLAAIAKTASVKLLLGHDSPDLPKAEDWTSQSDHFAFHGRKIPFVYFGVEDHKDYHQPTDDFVNINQAFYVRAVETILTVIKKFDRSLTQIEKQKAAATNK